MPKREGVFQRSSLNFDEKTVHLFLVITKQVNDVLLCGDQILSQGWHHPLQACLRNQPAMFSSLFCIFSFSIFIYFFSLQGRSRFALVISLQSGRHGSCVGQNAMIGICARLASAQCAVQCTVHSAESRCTIALHCRDPDSNLNSSAIFNAPPPLLKEEIATFLYCFILNRHNILWVSISTILCKNSSKCKNQTNVEKIISRSY